MLQCSGLIEPIALLLQEMRIVDVPVYDFTTHQRSSETRRVRCRCCCHLLLQLLAVADAAFSSSVLGHTWVSSPAGRCLASRTLSAHPIIAPSMPAYRRCPQRMW